MVLLASVEASESSSIHLLPKMIFLKNKQQKTTTKIKTHTCPMMYVNFCSDAGVVSLLEIVVGNTRV